MKISLVFCLAVVVVLGICVIGLFHYIGTLRKEYDTLLLSYRNMENLNRTLRSQRHDYMNHLQVVISMIELEEYDNLKEYLEPVYLDIQKTGKALKTSKPAVNALLSAKAGEAESKGIDMYLQIKSDLKYLSIQDWELCKVLSNIIDNAVTALCGDESCSKKSVIVDITEDKEKYIFEISNNGPMIPIEMQKNIFKYGITSKDEEGHGIGLAIVEKVVKEHAGTIMFQSNEQETKFVIKFEKKGGEGQ